MLSAFQHTDAPHFLIVAGVNWLKFRLNHERRSNYSCKIRGLIVVIAMAGFSIGVGWPAVVIAALAAQLPKLIAGLLIFVAAAFVPVASPMRAVCRVA